MGALLQRKQFKNILRLHSPIIFPSIWSKPRSWIGSRGQYEKLYLMAIRLFHGIDVISYVHEELKINTSSFPKFNQKWAFFQVFLHFSFMLFLYSVHYVDDIIKFLSFIFYLFKELSSKFFLSKEMGFFDSQYDHDYV